MKKVLKKHGIPILGCCVFVLMTCSFGGCDCQSKCSGCAHVCHEETVPECLDNQVNVTSVTVKETKDDSMAKQKSETGLEWEVLSEGVGETPDVGKTVTVHYTGWLDENGEPGKKFDSSVDRGQKFSFKIGVGMVIPGWDEGVMNMKVGEKRRIFIPADLAYGSRGAGGVIPPNAALIFDVELFSVA